MFYFRLSFPSSAVMMNLIVSFLMTGPLSNELNKSSQLTFHLYINMDNVKILEFTVLDKERNGVKPGFSA